jgi:hypothetical protein
MQCYWVNLGAGAGEERRKIPRDAAARMARAQKSCLDICISVCIESRGPNLVVTRPRLRPTMRRPQRTACSTLRLQETARSHGEGLTS